MNVDASEILKALGGGPIAVMVLGMALAIVFLWRRYVATQDARISDQKEHTAQLIETMRTVDKAIDFVGERRG